MKIYRGVDELIIIDPQAASNFTWQVMGEHRITLVFELPECFELRIGDYIVESGINYRLNQLPTIKKLSKKLFQYNAVFEHPKYDLLKRIFLLFDNTGVSIQGEFSMTGNAADFMALLAANMNRSSSGWLVGDVLDTEYITLTFSNETCMAVIERLASEFDTEYHVVNKTMHLQKMATFRELTLEYGESAYDIERVSVNTADIVTRLYAFGSDKNLAANYRGGSKRLMMADELTYIDSPNIALYGVIEGSKTFDDIYPRLSLTGAGIVTAVGDKFTFTDSGMDFDVNECLLNQVPPKVRFLTGECAGYEFEVRSYNKLTETYVILENRSEPDLLLPNDLLKPAVGDKYTLLDIAMPSDPYLVSAEHELAAVATEFLHQVDNPQVQYRVRFSEVFAKKELPVIQCGDQVRIIDADLGIDTQIRINKLQRGIRNKYHIEIELAKTVQKTKLETITDEIKDFNNEVIVSNSTSRSRWIEAYQRAKEIKELVFDPDGYFDPGNIRPGSIETGMIAVGSRSQQLQTSCLLKPNYAGNPQSFYWSHGLLTHFTINNDGTAKEWTIGGGNYSIIGDDQSRPLYIYARCSRTGSTGDIYLNATALRFDSSTTHWLFLLGILHSPFSGVRGISLSYGQTLINGQWITTGVISSIDGSTKFDLNSGEIYGNIRFLSNGVLKNIDQVIGGIQVGGKNLLSSSRVPLFNPNYVGSGTSVKLTDEADPYHRATPSWYPVSLFGGGITYQGGVEYISSIYVRHFAGVAMEITYYNEGNVTDSAKATQVPSGQWTRISTKAFQASGLKFLILIAGLANVPVDYKKVKIETGNIATDWTPATEEIDNMIAAVATDAQEALEAAQITDANITNLNNYVNTSFKDGLISNAEAIAIGKYINEINASKEQIFKEYVDLYQNTYLTGSAKTNLLNAKITLFGTIDALLTSIQDAIADGSTTIAERDNVNQKYEAYISALGDYSSAVTLAAKAIQDKLNQLAADMVNILEIGTRNLIINSGALITGATNSSGGIILSEYHALSEALVVGQKYTFSYKKVSGIDLTFLMLADINMSAIAYIPVTDARATFVCEVSNAVRLFFIGPVNSSYALKNFKLERGGKATDWTPAPEESEARLAALVYLREALMGSTDASGGLLLTNLILLKNQSEAVTGGLSGLTGDNVANWYGGNYTQATADAAKPFRSAMATGGLDKKDGSGHRAFGKLAWDTLGNTFFAGIIQALAGGKIGQFDIFDNTLRSSSMSFSETPVETLASLLSPTPSSFSEQSSWSSSTTNEPAIAISQAITLSADSTVKFRATCTPDIEEPYTRMWAVEVLDNNDNIVFTNSGSGHISNQLFSVNLPAGTYYIRARAALLAPTWVTQYNSASITGETTNVIYAYSYTFQTKIGGDGLYSFWNSERYIYFKSDYGFEGRFGLIGLRFIVGQSNPQKMVGGTWSNL
jgi:hypothetical protein